MNVADIFSPARALLNVFTALPMAMESKGASINTKILQSYFKSYDLSDLHNGCPSYEIKRSEA